MHHSRRYIGWSLRCSWSIACRRCSNYIFILDLTPGFSIKHKDNLKMKLETFKYGIWCILYYRVDCILNLWCPSYPMSTCGHVITLCQHKNLVSNHEQIYLIPWPKLTELFKQNNIIKWKHFPRNWPFVWVIHQSLVKSQHKGGWRRVK